MQHIFSAHAQTEVLHLKPREVIDRYCKWKKGDFVTGWRTPGTQKL